MTGIVDESRKELIISKLNSLPEEIEEQLNRAYALEQQRQKALDELKWMQMNVERDVAEEVLPEIKKDTAPAKKKYPNQTAREAEVAYRLRNSQEYQEKKEGTDKVTADLELTKIKVEVLKYKFSAAKKIADLEVSTELLMSSVLKK